jgi:hypothetical protein
VKNKNDIYKISDLIFLSFKSKLSEEQQSFLQNWINEAKENKVLYNKLKTKQEYNNTLKTYELFEPTKNFDHILSSVGKKQRIVRMKRFAVACSIAFLALISFLFIKTEFDNAKLVAQVQNIKPGSKHATLILHTGKEIDLKDKSFNLKISENLAIDNHQNTLTYQFDKSKMNGLASNLENVLIVPRGGEYKLVLSDGTVITLNSESTLRFPPNFDGNIRKVAIEGEGYFEVAHDKSKKFIVDVDGKEVEVLGTKFNVKAYKNEDYISTTLVEGAIKFKVGEDSQLLKPDQRLKLNNRTNEIQLSEVNAKNIASWTEGKYHFQSTSLEEIFNQLERWYDFETVFENEKVKALKFRGVIKRDMDFKKLCKIISETTNVKFRIEEKRVLVFN